MLDGRPERRRPEWCECVAPRAAAELELELNTEQAQLLAHILHPPHVAHVHKVVVTPILVNNQSDAQHPHTAKQSAYVVNLKKTTTEEINEILSMQQYHFPYLTTQYHFTFVYLV